MNNNNSEQTLVKVIIKMFKEYQKEMNKLKDEQERILNNFLKKLEQKQISDIKKSLNNNR